jgi:predicted Zn finger-like uncharacterized protein
MDVRCSRCGTEYELDEARVASTGTPVKCSNCGHVFKVMPGGAAREATTPGMRMPTADTAQPSLQDDVSSSSPPQDWSVRRVDGSTLRFRELTTLQKWIVERKVGRDDEISRSGRTWKKLGEIAELTSFFQVVEAADAAQRAAQQGPPPAVDATPSSTTTGRFRSLGLSSPEFGAAAASPPAPSSSSPAPASSPPASSSSSSSPSSSSSAAAPPSSPSSSSPAVVSSPAPPVRAENDDEPGLDALDDDDPVLAWQRRRRNWTIAGVTAVVVAVAVVVIVTVVPLSPRLPEPLLAQAQGALRDDDDAARSAAMAVLAEQTAPAASTWRARLLVARADAAADLARLVEHGRALDATLDAAAPRAAASALVAEAEAALAPLHGESAGVDVVLADAALALARSDADGLARAVANARQNERQNERQNDDSAGADDELRLLLTLAEARAFDPQATGAADALAGVQSKLALFDDGRARAAAVHVAVAHLAVVAAKQREAHAATPADVVAATRALVDKLGSADPRRAVADKIVALAAAPPPEPAVVDPNAPVVDPNAAATATDPQAPSTATPTTTPPTTTTTGANEAKPADALPADYDALMRRGEQALVAERSQTAFEAFKKASQLRPGVARPWLKLGWASLDVSRYGEAERSFARALSIDATLAEAQFGLAESLRFAGKKPEALAAYRAYVAMDPNGRDAGIARRVIEELQ